MGKYSARDRQKNDTCRYVLACSRTSNDTRRYVLDCSRTSNDTRRYVLDCSRTSNDTRRYVLDCSRTTHVRQIDKETERLYHFLVLELRVQHMYVHIIEEECEREQSSSDTDMCSRSIGIYIYIGNCMCAHLRVYTYCTHILLHICVPDDENEQDPMHQWRQRSKNTACLFGLGAFSHVCCYVRSRMLIHMLSYQAKCCITLSCVWCTLYAL